MELNTKQIEFLKSEFSDEEFKAFENMKNVFDTNKIYILVFEKELYKLHRIDGDKAYSFIALNNSSDLKSGIFPIYDIPTIINRNPVYCFNSFQEFMESKMLKEYYNMNNKKP